MSLDITVQFDVPAPETCPATYGELIEDLNTRVSATITTEIKPYVFGADTPAVEDQDKVWERVDANGRPLGRYVFYDGSWRREYPVGIGAIMMYSGDPAIDFAETGGRGTIGGMFDGWNLANGENGTPNLSDRFIVGAKMDDLAVGYPEGNGPWKTTVTGESTQSGDGVHEITLTAENTFRPPIPAIKVSKWEADGNALNAAGDLYGRGSTFDLVPADAGNTEPEVIPTLPKYYALAYIAFIGYE